MNMSQLGPDVVVVQVTSRPQTPANNTQEKQAKVKKVLLEKDHGIKAGLQDINV